MEPNKDSITEGIVTVISPKPSNESKDIYNIKSGVHDVLIIEVCKNQHTKESVIDCLSIQQQTLVEKQNNYNIYGCYTAIFCAVIMVLCFILLMRKKSHG